MAAQPPAKEIRKVQRTSIKVGDGIYAWLVIDARDLANPNSTSSTPKRIKKGLPVKRLAVVVEVEPHEIKVLYLATFQDATHLKQFFNDISLWYPVHPAPKEGAYEPIIVTDPDPGPKWVNLRESFPIRDDIVERAMDKFYPPEAIAELVKHIGGAHAQPQLPEKPQPEKPHTEKQPEKPHPEKQPEKPHTEKPQPEKPHTEKQPEKPHTEKPPEKPHTEKPQPEKPHTEKPLPGPEHHNTTHSGSVLPGHEEHGKPITGHEHSGQAPSSHHVAHTGRK